MTSKQEEEDEGAAPGLTSGRWRRSGGLPLPIAALAGFAVAVLAVFAIAAFNYATLTARESSADRVAASLEVVGRLRSALSTLQSAETGQRGYLLTADEAYLQPFIDARSALPGEFTDLARQLAGRPAQQRRLDALQRLARTKLEELEQTIALKRRGDTAGALAIVRGDTGRLLMDRMRALIAEMEGEERAMLAARQAEWRDAVASSTLVTLGGSAVLLVLILTAGALASRDFIARAVETWLRSGQAALAGRLQGEQRLEVLGRNVLSFLAEYLDAQAGAVYLAEADGSYRRFAGYALPAGWGDEVVRGGEGLLGQAASEGRTLHVKQVPEGFLPVSSTLGGAPARELLLAPARIEGRTLALVELGFLRRLRPQDLELLERVSELLAMAVRSARDRSRLEHLLEETQQQAEELQAQQEELRAANEELQEQGRTLQESRTRLESQQAELEETNTQLEEQASVLELQKSELTASRAALAERAQDLERMNRYKSEFLANMSHELRTPLNSTLILARLLADNPAGNLSAEQVRYAQTISSAGHDLLALINDILDLAKIEAGRMELAVETVALPELLRTIAEPFEPAARAKGLDFELAIGPGTPQHIRTDPQRLAQVVRNLLANAVKFTESGRVALHAGMPAPGQVAITVSDTGIGIAPEQQQMVFEAFRQADGSTHRKYGGTGLGLSISRDLARLLGGSLGLQSEPGRGSSFTLALPLEAPGGAAPAQTAQAAQTPQPASTAQPMPQPRAPIEPAADLGPMLVADDRERAAGEQRLILVVEDDARFAAVLRDLVHEMDFRCVVVPRAAEGLAAVRSLKPSAVLLDLHLPDHSGLALLEQLRTSELTRRIPVHVISAADRRQEALALGAVGYDIKPVERSQIIASLRRLEAQFARRLRQVLVVEADAAQRESIERLVAGPEVEVTGVATAAAALARLAERTFDCMITALDLPDASGLELLRRMGGDGHGAFPPVIVHTARTLAAGEEQQLRRYSKSIIVKDERSPQRLLDEVTLFLHAVESALPRGEQRPARSARERDGSLAGRRILVVEDDVRNVFALSSLLEPRGAKVEIARNGHEALQALERHARPGAPPIDLVLMDIMMPEMDGLTAMREIRRRAEWRKLPIIALTAKAMKDDQDKCLAAGANDYIAKPLDVEKLLSLLRVWMPK